LEMGQPEDAIPWLKMALKAKRYESYCFPQFNLGRAYEGMGRFDLALERYRLALNENPRYLQAAKALERVALKLVSPNPGPLA
ncbi:MAG: tetratricopeptide repeat protein, partial [Acidobacteriota bacterium]|nr:tetratricopeptide repeat protein [Acidobacteriota bacterium]